MQQRTELERLDLLIANLGETAGPCGLLLEHIEAARRSLLGSMGAEYDSNLKFASESVACIPSKAARAEAKRILQGLIDAGAARDRIWSSDHMGSQTRARSAGGSDV